MCEIAVEELSNITVIIQLCYRRRIVKNGVYLRCDLDLRCFLLERWERLFLEPPLDLRCFFDFPPFLMSDCKSAMVGIPFPPTLFETIPFCTFPPAVAVGTVVGNAASDLKSLKVIPVPDMYIIIVDYISNSINQLL